MIQHPNACNLLAGKFLSELEALLEDGCGNLIQLQQETILSG